MSGHFLKTNNLFIDLQVRVISFSIDLTAPDRICLYIFFFYYFKYLLVLVINMFGSTLFHTSFKSSTIRATGSVIKTGGTTHKTCIIISI